MYVIINRRFAGEEGNITMTTQQERVNHLNLELELAKQVQRSVLCPPIDDIHIHIDAIYEPSHELSGDFYAWYRINKNQYGIIIMDVMGHGISSSLVCMFMSSLLQDTIKKISDPERVILELNRYMNRLQMPNKLENYYFSAIYIMLDTKKKTIEYINAGHPPGVVFLDYKVALLEQSCYAIGLFDNMNVNKGKIKYRNSIQIMLFTDGLTELLKMDRKIDIDTNTLTNLFLDYKDIPLSEFQSIISNMIHTNPHQEDDICFIRISSKS